MQVGSGEKAEEGFTVTSRKQEEISRNIGIMEYWNIQRRRRQDTGDSGKRISFEFCILTSVFS
jgi:hypothetical protein